MKEKVKEDNIKEETPKSNKVTESVVDVVLPAASKKRILLTSSEDEDLVVKNRIQLIRSKINNSLNDIVINSAEWETICKLMKVLQVTGDEHLDDYSRNVIQNVCNSLNIGLKFTDDVELVDFKEFEDEEVLIKAKSLTEFKPENHADLVGNLCCVLDSIEKECGASIKVLSSDMYDKLFSKFNMKLDNINKIDNYISYLVSMQYLDVTFTKETKLEIDDSISELKEIRNKYSVDKAIYYRENFKNKIKTGDEIKMKRVDDGFVGSRTAKKQKSVERAMEKTFNNRAKRKETTTDSRKETETLSAAEKRRLRKTGASSRRDEDDDRYSRKDRRTRKSSRRDRDDDDDRSSRRSRRDRDDEDRSSRRSSKSRRSRRDKDEDEDRTSRRSSKSRRSRRDRDDDDDDRSSRRSRRDRDDEDRTSRRSRRDEDDVRSSRKTRRDSNNFTDGNYFNMKYDDVLDLLDKLEDYKSDIDKEVYSDLKELNKQIDNTEDINYPVLMSILLALINEDDEISDLVKESLQMKNKKRSSRKRSSRRRDRDDDEDEDRTSRRSSKSRRTRKSSRRDRGNKEENKMNKKLIKSMETLVADFRRELRNANLLDDVVEYIENSEDGMVDSEEERLLVKLLTSNDDLMDDNEINDIVCDIETMSSTKNGGDEKMNYKKAAKVLRTVLKDFKRELKDEDLYEDVKDLLEDTEDKVATSKDISKFIKTAKRTDYLFDEAKTEIEDLEDLVEDDEDDDRSSRRSRRDRDDEDRSSRRSSKSRRSRRDKDEDEDRTSRRSSKSRRSRRDRDDDDDDRSSRRSRRDRDDEDDDRSSRRSRRTRRSRRDRDDEDRSSRRSRRDRNSRLDFDDMDEPTRRDVNKITDIISDSDLSRSEIRKAERMLDDGEYEDLYDLVSEDKVSGKALAKVFRGLARIDSYESSEKEFVLGKEFFIDESEIVVKCNGLDDVVDVFDPDDTEYITTKLLGIYNEPNSKAGLELDIPVISFQKRNPAKPVRRTAGLR